MSTIHRTAASRRAAARSLLGLALAGLLAGACNTSHHASRHDIVDQDYRLRHPILFSEEPEVLDIPVGMNGGPVSPEMAHIVARFAGRYRREGSGALYIQMPVGAANDIAASEVGHSVRHVVVAAGIVPERVKLLAYRADGRDRPAPVRVSYLKMKPSVPSCGLWPSEHLENAYGKDMHNMGCANQANLAAMVENPADLLGPRAEDPADGARRAKVIIDYSAGKDPRSKTKLKDISAEETK